MREFLVALSLFCANYHEGQWSKLYRVGCLARQYLLRWYQIRSPEEWSEATYISRDCQARAEHLYVQLVDKYFPGCE